MSDQPYRIPLFDLNFDGREEAAVVQTLRAGWISMGPRTAELEAQFAAALGVRHAVAVTNGTAALHLALHVLGIGPGDEVIVPSLTFVATVNAVRYVGARPVFCDIVGPGDLTLDPRALPPLLTPRTRAIIVMHYGGFSCAMAPIVDFARQHDLRVVEDAAHAPLSEYEGRKLGTIGDAGCFSFFSNKNLTTAEGGMLVTNDADCDRAARLLRSHGMTSLSYERSRGHATAYDVVDVGYNYRLDDLRASLGLVQLEKMPADLVRRARVRDHYGEQLGGLNEMIIPFAAHRGPVSNYIFPIVLADGGAARRDAVRQRLHAAGIQTSVHYPAVHRFHAYGGGTVRLPQTERVADHVISLPMYGALTSEAVRYVATELRRALS